MAPIIEEIIFRGLVLNELKKVVPACPAIILQAIIFGIYHMNPLQGVYASLLGIVLGIAAEKTGSIWTPILIHISFNSISTLLSKCRWIFRKAIFRPVNISRLFQVLCSRHCLLLWYWGSLHDIATSPPNSWNYLSEDSSSFYCKSSPFTNITYYIL